MTTTPQWPWSHHGELDLDLDSEELRRLKACWNVCQGFDTELLEHIVLLGETMLTRFKARDNVEEILIADRLRFMQERDAARAAIKNLLSTIHQYDDGDYYLGTDAEPMLDQANRLSAETAEPVAPARQSTPPAPALCLGNQPQCKRVPDGRGSKCTTCGDTIPF